MPASTAAPEKCSAYKAVKFYAGRIAYWRARVGADKRSPSETPVGPAMARKSKGVCPRYLAHVLQRKARAAHRAYDRYVEYHWHWQAWLPAKWARIGACETGYGQRPGNWRHSNSSYEGAFGFAKSSWDSFKYRADPKAGPYPADAWQATPRQQYEVALAIYRAYGFSGWGCRGA
jgi:hypothetical protein